MPPSGDRERSRVCLDGRNLEIFVFERVERSILSRFEDAFKFQDAREKMEEARLENSPLFFLLR